MQYAITITLNNTIDTAAAKAHYVKADVVKKIGMFAAILACVLIAVNM